MDDKKPGGGEELTVPDDVSPRRGPLPKMIRPDTTAALIWLALAASLGHAQDLLAELEYGTFQGAYSEQYNISYWQKIPFAAPPVGENR